MKKKCLYLFFSVCSLTVNAQKKADPITAFVNDSVIKSGHVGLSFFEPATGNYLYNYNADKNFTPSSNLKLFTLYAGLKYLGDSIPAIKFAENDSSIILYPTGDPTLLHTDFVNQPLIQFLKNTQKSILILPISFKPTPYGNGWAWNDYPDYYMAERAALPVYGNAVTFACNKNAFKAIPENSSSLNYILSDSTTTDNSITRAFFKNNFTVYLNRKNSEIIVSPFITSYKLAASLLADAVGKPVSVIEDPIINNYIGLNFKTIYSQPVDSLFKPMMFNSDNFFAEQTLLMASDKVLGYMSDAVFIDSLMQTVFKDMPTKARWVDGCGLSRYNLFSPLNFVYLLNKMENEFGLQRLKRILTTGGEGTLRGYYENDKKFIYAKTGSMSNNVSLSGYLITQKNKLLLFSVHINNFNGSGRAGRRAIEKLVQYVRQHN